jgi:hypothetical protein
MPLINQSVTDDDCAQLVALRALLDNPEHAVEAIAALDRASIVAVTKAAAIKCHETLLVHTDAWDDDKCAAAWRGLRRTQKVQKWLFDLQWTKKRRPAPGVEEMECE